MGRAVGALTVTCGAVLLTAGCATHSGAHSTVATGQQHLPAPVAATATEASAPEVVTIGHDSARTAAVATDDRGVLAPPQDVHQLGWWVDSALPGSGHGTVVITGHIDDVAQGSGFASRFGDLHPADTVTVTSRDHAQHTYRVTRTVTSDKAHPSNAFGELNRLDGDETLALVTCGGPFIGPPLGYEDNIITLATPA
ncbi:class F sortase [Williamsia sterculiae]|uniref:Sortase family protein n=1 Tax=Williamsia sterculiae TaxID=1344003 RepID=A0A1N7D1Q5_9NOCA|nr:class F sortase [Williamsia sterculiae]SIR69644.1 Sortase family protein [Williamsia sterculiae]